MSTKIASCPDSAPSATAVAEFIGDTEATVQATYSHMMPDDRDRARKAKKQFFVRPAAEHQETSDSRDVP